MQPANIALTTWNFLYAYGRVGQSPAIASGLGIVVFSSIIGLGLSSFLTLPS